MEAVRQACTNVPPEDYGGCLITQMPGAGASPEAVAFSRRLR